MQDIKIGTNGFITLELFYDGKSLGFVTWCPVCQKGFDTGAETCPHCGTPVPEAERRPH